MGTQQISRSQAKRKQAIVKNTNNELNFIFKRPIFWRPSYIVQSAWLEHVPFAFWLVDTLRPRKIVELGTHYGSSYFSFCQSVAKLDLDTQCYAVDTWDGDEHASQYDEEIYQQVSEYNQQHYSDFSTLVRSTFDQALEYFPRNSIDLLHIDGQYNPEAVRHNFESWLPKLSDKAVIIMHNTKLRENGFEVFQLMDELKQHYPYFEFNHGNGLGVIGTGNKQLSDMKNLYKIAENAQAARQVQEIFYRLGSGCSDSWENIQLKRTLKINAENKRNKYQIQMEQQITKAQAETVSHDGIQSLTAQEKQVKINDLKRMLGERFNELAILTRRLEEHEQALTNSASEYQKLSKEHANLQQNFAIMEQQTNQESLQLKEHINQLVEHNERLERSITERYQELATMAQHMELLNRDLQLKNQQLQQARARNKNLKNTVSWKLTSPVRAIGRTFKKNHAGANRALNAAEHITNSGLFDEQWYLDHYPEAAKSELTAVEHFIKHGAKKGYNPSDLFDTGWYLKTYPDVVQGKMNPLLHYIIHGKAEHRRCRPISTDAK